MKAAAWFATAAVLVAVTFFVSRQREEAPASPPPIAVIREAPPARPPAEPPAAITVMPIAETASSLNDPSGIPADDISILSQMVFEYGKILGGNPVGENDEITAALMGENPKRLAFLPQQGPFLDASGRLIDRWGTPYFFHALSGSKMEIISAGPDLRYHTADDITSD